MDDEKRYETSDGEAVTLDKMVRVEPEWAASRLRYGERLELAHFTLRLDLERTLRALDVRVTECEAAERGSNTPVASDELADVAAKLRSLLSVKS